MYGMLCLHARNNTFHCVKIHVTNNKSNQIKLNQISVLYSPLYLVKAPPGSVVTCQLLVCALNQILDRRFDRIIVYIVYYWTKGRKKVYGQNQFPDYTDEVQGQERYVLILYSAGPTPVRHADWSKVLIYCYCQILYSYKLLSADSKAMSSPINPGSVSNV